MIRRITILGVLLVTAAPCAAQKAAPAKGHALLVGCSHYPNLEERYQLKGPANDVLLMRDLLVKQFGFAAENIALLAEHAGKDRLPTRANIEKEFRRLGEVAKA